MKRCPKCNKMYSDMIRICPDCNFSLSDGNSLNRNNLGDYEQNLQVVDSSLSGKSNVDPMRKRMKWILIILLILIGIGIAIALYFNSDAYRYSQACKAYESKNYYKAAEMFEELGSYQNSYDNYQASMVGYIKVNYNNDDTITFDYVKRLQSMNFQNIDDVYHDLYDWKITNIKFNISKSDTTNNSIMISKLNTWYVHYQVEGGEPDAKLKVRVHADWPVGASSTKDVVQSGKTDGEYGYQDYGYSGGESNGKVGTFTAEFYDADTNKKLGSKSVIITK